VPEHKAAKAATEQDREVVRCKTCGLVQYRTRTNNCRRCLRILPPPVEFLLPPPPAQELPGDDRQLFENWPNRDTVENIGQRIRQLRESRGMTQSQLQARSRVSRSYLSRIESGQMTPSLGTLEKIAEALGVGLNRFFVPETDGQALMEDPFIQGLRPFLRQLNSEQWQWILKRLQAITDNVTSRAAAPPAPMAARGGVVSAVPGLPKPGPVPAGSRSVLMPRDGQSAAQAGRNGVHVSPASRAKNVPAASDLRPAASANGQGERESALSPTSVTRRPQVSGHWGATGHR
jgi:transcriptional regulator with XRE-family HTH domain